VTPPLADALRAQGIEFIDAAGNAFLNQPPLLVFVKGQRPAEERPALERGRAFQATGLQVLFALLARPELVARPYREIAAAAGVAHGTVGWVMAELPGLGYAAKVGGRRRLINGERLFDRWTEAYTRTLRPKLLLGRYRGDLGALQQTTPWPDGVLIGGELAAARLTRHLRPGTATFYAEAVDPKVLLKLTLKAGAQGNVDFRRRFWNFPAEETGLTPNLLVYADRLVVPYKPRMIVLHAGGNDIHNGRTPQQVTDDFKAFVARVRQTMPSVPIAFTSITPSPGRWSEADARMAANKRIQSYIATQPNLLYIDLWDAFLQPDGRPRANLYVEDQIHPNHDGYLLRVKIMTPMLGEKR
jgi:hypothetical protein